MSREEKRRRVRYKTSSTFHILMAAMIILAISEIYSRVYGNEHSFYVVRTGYYILGSAAMYCLTVHVPRMVKGIYVLRKIRRGTEL